MMLGHIFHTFCTTRTEGLSNDRKRFTSAHRLYCSRFRTDVTAAEAVGSTITPSLIFCFHIQSKTRNTLTQVHCPKSLVFARSVFVPLIYNIFAGEWLFKPRGVFTFATSLSTPSPSPTTAHKPSTQHYANIGLDPGG